MGCAELLEFRFLRALALARGDEKEVPLVLRRDPIFSPLQYFKNSHLSLL